MSPNCRNKEKMNRTKVKIVKKLITFLLFSVFFIHVGLAIEIDIGLNYGKRQLKDSALKDIYGDGYVFNTYVRLTPHNFFSIEASYEGGYKKDGLVGIYNENSTLEINGWELCGIFHYRFKQFMPYVKFGYGYYTYKQDIDSDFIRFKVDHHKSTYVVGAGLNIYLIKGFFLIAEVKHVPLKVKPFDIEKDLSGLRYLLGLGFEFEL